MEDKLGHFGPDARTNFLKRAWNVSVPVDHATPTFKHYSQCCNLAFLSPYAQAIASRYNADVLFIIDELKKGKTRPEILIVLIDILHSGHLDDTCRDDDRISAECLIAFTLRIWLMCNVGSIGGESNLDQREIRWDGHDIRAFLLHAFPKQSKLKDMGRLGRSFQARNLERLGSIQVLWTDNLLDHLRLHDPSDEGMPFRVSIFHHAQFLSYHKETDIFPEGFVAETRRTLALLLPGYDKSTRAWFRKERKREENLDATACLCEFLAFEQRTLESFEYWRDRITILKQAYNDSDPKTIVQWWKDGRNSVQWSTFWIAALILVLTVLFGLIQTIEGALQVYKAYHPN